MNTGIDYGNGLSNIDKSTGIRFGVINQGECLQAWVDSSEPYYGEPTCGHCGNKAVEYDEGKHGEYSAEEHECTDYACETCEKVFGSESAYSDEAHSFGLDDGEYNAEAFDDSGDIFIIKSPYYTKAQFCSPCAPGACYLTNPCDDGEKAYCFGHDFFEVGTAPYPVYSVETNELIPGNVAAE